MGNRAVTTLSNMFTNLNLSDMEVGYKVFKAAVLQGIDIKSGRFGVEPELTAKIAKKGWRIYEVPIQYHGRTTPPGRKSPGGTASPPSTTLSDLNSRIKLSGAGLRAVGRASPPANRFGGQGRPPHRHQLFFTFHGVRDEMIVVIQPFCK